MSLNHESKHNQGDWKNKVKPNKNVLSQSVHPDGADHDIQTSSRDLTDHRMTTGLMDQTKAIGDSIANFYTESIRPNWKMIVPAVAVLGVGGFFITKKVISKLSKGSLDLEQDS
jgi:hypothetical protein